MNKELKLRLNIKFKCEDNEIEEVKKRLQKAIIENIKGMEGLFTTGINPFSKTYYFSVREVRGVRK